MENALHTKARVACLPVNPITETEVAIVESIFCSTDKYMKLFFPSKDYLR